MSGGHFDYAYFKVIYFADILKLDLDEPREWVQELSPECIERLRQIEKEARHFAEKMRTTEWFLSGDIGEDAFLETTRTADALRKTDS